MSLLGRLNLTTEAGYAQAMLVLKSPESISGYREIRYPKMDRVRQQIEAELSRQVLPPAEQAAGVLDALRTPTRV